MFTAILVLMTLWAAAQPATAKYDPAVAAAKYDKLSTFTTSSGFSSSFSTRSCSGSSTCATPLIDATEEIKISGDFSGSVQIGLCTKGNARGDCWMIDLSDC